MLLTVSLKGSLQNQTISLVITTNEMKIHCPVNIKIKNNMS